MATIQAKRIKDALKKVQRVGRIEEKVTIAGCEIALQNLAPSEFEAALKEIEGLEDVAYAYAYQLEQVARSIVEIDGQDLREADFIEDEVPVGQYVLEVLLPNKAVAEDIAEKLRAQKLNAVLTQQETGGTKTVKQERHQWLKENVLKGWGREALTVGWRKFNEVLILADEVAKKDVKFRIPDETAEDKYRRLLNDLREAEGELPDELINRLLDESGFMKKTLREELDAVAERLTQMRDPTKPEAPATVEQPAEVSAVVTPPPVERASVQAPSEAVQQAMANRARMNQQGADIPVPAAPREAVLVPAAPRVQVPEQIRRSAQNNTQGVLGPQADANGNNGGISTRRVNRATEIAALEAQVDPAAADEGGVTLAGHQPEVAELSHKIKPVDPKGVRTILDKPPIVGINPRFKPR